MEYATRAVIASMLSFLLAFSVPVPAIAGTDLSVAGVEADEVIRSQPVDGLVWLYKSMKVDATSDVKANFVVGVELAQPEPQPEPQPEQTPGEEGAADATEGGGQGAVTEGAGAGENAADEQGSGSSEAGGDQAGQPASERGEGDGPASDQGQGAEPADELVVAPPAELPKSITIPDAVDGASMFGVAAYEGESGAGWGQFEELVLSANLKAIRMQAFKKAAGLERVIIKDSSITAIGSEAFAESGITAIEAPATLESVGELAFSNCNDLTSFTFAGAPSSFSYKGSGIFSGCKSLVIAEVPEGVAKVGTSMFEGCAKLRYIDKTQPDVCALPASVATVEKNAFAGCTSLQQIEFPQGSLLEGVDEGAFAGCTSLSAADFHQCLELIDIEKGAFSGCTKLAAVNLHECSKFVQFGPSAFEGCAELSTVILPEDAPGFVKLNEKTFKGAGLRSIEVPASVTKIMNAAFSECKNLMLVTGCKGVVQVNSEAFSGTAMEGLPEFVYKQLRFISGTAFEGCARYKYDESAYAQFGLHNEGGKYYRYDTAVTVEGVKSYEYARDALEEINAYRATSGVKELSMDEELLEAAMQRAWELPVYLGEKRPNGLEFPTLSAKAQAQALAVSTTTGKGAAKQMIDYFKDVALSGDFASAGIGCFISNGEFFWVALFGEGQAEQPAITAQDETYTATSFLRTESKELWPKLKIEALSSATSWKAGQHVQFALSCSPVISQTLPFRPTGAIASRVAIPSSAVFFSNDSDVMAIDQRTGAASCLKAGKVEVRAGLYNEDTQEAHDVVRATYTIAARDSVAGVEISGVKNATYSGSAISQDITVKLNGVALVEGRDYEVKYKDNVNAGEATVTVVGKSEYDGDVSARFTIARAKQPMKVARIAKKVTAKKKAFAVVKVSKAKGAVTYKNASKDKAAKKLVVNKKTGKVTVPAKLKAATYKLIVQAAVDGKVKGVQNYYATSKSLAVKVRVKR